MDSQAFISSLQNAESLVSTDLDNAVSEFELALSLYEGEYLPDARYETWAAAEREHLTVQFLRSADRLTDIYLNKDRFENAVDLSQRILSVDSCWERAYRHLMTAYDGLGDHGQVRRTYLRCVETLHDEMEITPSIETDRTYQQLLSKS